MCRLKVAHGIKWKASSGNINGFIQVCVLKSNVCLQPQHPTWFWDLKKAKSNPSKLNAPMHFSLSDFYSLGKKADD